VYRQLHRLLGVGMVTGASRSRTRSRSRTLSRTRSRSRTLSRSILPLPSLNRPRLQLLRLPSLKALARRILNPKAIAPRRPRPKAIAPLRPSLNLNPPRPRLQRATARALRRVPRNQAAPQSLRAPVRPRASPSRRQRHNPPPPALEGLPPSLSTRR
jgi:hypothetical protein